LLQKHGQKIFGTASMGEVNFTKSWIDKAGLFLPFLGIEEISYVRRWISKFIIVIIIFPNIIP